MQVRHGPAAVRGDAPRHDVTGFGREGGEEGAPSQKTCRSSIRSPRGRRKRAPFSRLARHRHGGARLRYACCGPVRPRPRRRRERDDLGREGADGHSGGGHDHAAVGRSADREPADAVRRARAGEPARRVLLRHAHVLVRLVREPDRPARPARPRPAGSSRSTACRRPSGRPTSCSTKATRCCGTTPRSARPAARRHSTSEKAQAEALLHGPRAGRRRRRLAGRDVVFRVNGEPCPLDVGDALPEASGPVGARREVRVRPLRRPRWSAGPLAHASLPHLAPRARSRPRSRRLRERGGRRGRGRRWGRDAVGDEGPRSRGDRGHAVSSGVSAIAGARRPGRRGDPLRRPASSSR